MRQCCGIHVDFPPGSSTHSSYPFGIHDELGDPWDYSVTKGTLVLRAKGCAINMMNQKLGPCDSCKVLTNNKNLQGILQWIKTGVHENTPLMYHSIKGLVALAWRKARQLKALQLRRLNDMQKLEGKATALDDMKWWVMAICSGKVECVNRLVKINLARRGGIWNLLDLYDRAAKQVYHPQNYTEENNLQGLLLWRLSGARVAEIAHQALNLPSFTSLHHQMLIPQLLVSPSIPTRLEIETNVANNFKSMYKLLESHWLTESLIKSSCLMSLRPRKDRISITTLTRFSEFVVSTERRQAWSLPLKKRLTCYWKVLIRARCILQLRLAMSRHHVSCPVSHNLNQATVGALGM